MGRERGEKNVKLGFVGSDNYLVGDFRFREGVVSGSGNLARRKTEQSFGF